MEAIAKDAFTDEVRSEIFNELDIDFEQVQDLEGFENFVYGFQDRVIRITHDSHRTEEQLLGEMEFVQYLAEKGATVCRPRLSRDGDLVETRGEFHICQFDRSDGESNRRGPYSTDLIRAWGAGIGTMHRLAAGFEPVHRRQDWLEDENHHFSLRIPAIESKVLQVADGVMQELGELPRRQTQYGLIHSDAHPGNFLIENDQPVFFDFDDCLYAWYGYDLATVLLGYLVIPGADKQETERAAMARTFLLAFIEGYDRENPVDALMIDKMPLLLKLREISLYAVIHSHIGPDNIEEEYPAAFMKGRRERLEAGMPFVDLDFGEFC